MNSLQSSLAPPSSGLEASVIVPCRDEAELLLASLRALAQQVDESNRPFAMNRWEVLLLINNSRDESASAALQFQREHPCFPLQVVQRTFPAPQANIGFVRKQLMDTACERLLRGPSLHSLILSTDADSEVAPDWLRQNIAEARRGASAIGGRILMRAPDFERLDTHTKQLYKLDDRYHLLASWLESVYDPQAHDPWPRHYQHFGASLAVRPEVYSRAGGLPPELSLEDLAFYRALVRQDALFRHSPGVCVQTSGRLSSRTKRGFGQQLTKWQDEASALDVPSPDFLVEFFSLRRELRNLWHAANSGRGFQWSTILRLAARCHLEPEQLRESLHHEWFGDMFESLGLSERLSGGDLKSPDLQPLRMAVDELEQRFKQEEQAIPSTQKHQYDTAVHEIV